jgi:hypothetical protein
MGLVKFVSAPFLVYEAYYTAVILQKHITYRVNMLYF